MTIILGGHHISAGHTSLPNAEIGARGKLTTLSILMLALTAAGLIARTASSRRKVTPDGQLRLHSVRGAREILRAARQFFGEGGWTLEDRSSGWLAFSYELRPSLVVLVLLVLLGIIPGLVYFALARRTLKLVMSPAWDHADRRLDSLGITIWRVRTPARISPG